MANYPYKLADVPLLGRFAMNRQWGADMLHTGVTSTINGAYSGYEGLWNQDGTGYQSFASGAAGAVNAGLFIGGLIAPMAIAEKYGAVFSKNTYQRMFSKLIGGNKFTEVEAKALGGDVFAASSKSAGIFKNITFNNFSHNGVKNGLHISSFTNASKEAKMAESGVWRFATKAGEKSGFFAKESKLMSWRGLALAGTVIAASIAIDATAGLAGRIMDDANNAYIQSKYHSYDLREFNNRSMQQWEYNKQAQAMNSIMPYEQNNISLARIYYNR